MWVGGGLCVGLYGLQGNLHWRQGSTVGLNGKQEVVNMQDKLES